jgi:hypothetical protein
MIRWVVMRSPFQLAHGAYPVSYVAGHMILQPALILIHSRQNFSHSEE